MAKPSVVIEEAEEETASILRLISWQIRAFGEFRMTVMRNKTEVNSEVKISQAPNPELNLL
jgi:hypothetical protein